MSGDNGGAALSAQIKRALDATRAAYFDAISGSQVEGFLDVAVIAIDHAHNHQREVEAERARRTER